MFGRRKKKPEPKTFDRENYTPVVRCSICTGEQAAGFKNIHTGQFREIMLIRTPEDLQLFQEQYGLDSVPTEY